MNDFDTGFKLGRFFASMIVNDVFFGIAFRTGLEYLDGMDLYVFDFVIHIGYLQFAIGFDVKQGR